MKNIVMCFLVGIFSLSIMASANPPPDKDIAAQFKNSLFIGDSITKGFTNYEILPNDSVIAENGTTADMLYDEVVSGLAGKKPDYVFIMLGTNDMLVPNSDPKALYESNMTKLIQKVQEELPTTKIYLESIPPVSQQALQNEPRYKNIDDYNTLLQQLAEKLSVQYVDIGIVAKNNPDVFAEDGVHFKKAFYPLWLEELSKLL